MKYKFLIISLGIAAALPAAANMNLANTKWAVAHSGCKSSDQLGLSTVFTFPRNPAVVDFSVIAFNGVVHFVDNTTFRWIGESTLEAASFSGDQVYNRILWTDVYSTPTPKGIYPGGIKLQYRSPLSKKVRVEQIFWISKSGDRLEIIPIHPNLQKICGPDPEVFIHIFSKVSG